MNNSCIKDINNELGYQEGDIVIKAAANILINNQLKNFNYKPLDDDEDAYWYDTIVEELEKAGYRHYEISNFYKDKPSFHNLVYWHYEDYYGLGVSYLYEDVILSDSDQLFETIMMGLRLKEGLNLDKINRKFNIDFKDRYKDVIKKYIDLQFVEIENQYLKPTHLGFKYLNNILIDFFED